MTQEELETKGSELVEYLCQAQRVGLLPPRSLGPKRLDELNLQDLQIVLAWHEWSDGMEIGDALEIAEGKNPAFTDKQVIMDELVNVFGY